MTQPNNLVFFQKFHSSHDIKLIRRSPKDNTQRRTKKNIVKCLRMIGSSVAHNHKGLSTNTKLPSRNYTDSNLTIQVSVLSV